MIIPSRIKLGLGFFLLISKFTILSRSVQKNSPLMTSSPWLHQARSSTSSVRVKGSCLKLSPLLLLFFSFLWFRCAGEQPPSGGPVDTVPPKIVSTFPEPNTVHFSSNRIILEFDKYVDETSVESSVFISPSLGLLEFDWSGKEVEIRFHEPLRANTTYVVSVGTDVVDTRNKNRMERAFALAFSTGGTIDSGSVGGRVYDEKPEGVMIFAYRLDSLNRKALNPAVEKPDYLTQTGKEGMFSLTHLRFGEYRLFAVRDEYKNLVYDAGVDQIGMYRKDVLIDSTRPAIEGVDFRLTKEDTTRPQLFGAAAPNRNHVVLQFSKRLDPSRFSSNAILVVDTLSGDHLQVRDGFVDLQNPRSLVLVTFDQKPEVGYRVTVESVFDSAGNDIDPKSRTATFSGSAQPDSLAPTVASVSVADSARQLSLDARIEIIFDDVAERQDIEKAFSLLDSTGLRVSGIFDWKTSAAFQFVPRNELQSRAWYVLRLPLSAVVGPTGNRGKDSVFVRHFETVDKSKFGSLEGEVMDETSDSTRSAIIVTAKETRGRETKAYEAKVPVGREFDIPRLPEGSYILSAYRDDDNNGMYSFGKPFPFQPSELFAVYPDTVKVRARWPLHGIVIRLR
jgi:hypothetical protein